jgi:hypothetical protein
MKKLLVALLLTLPIAVFADHIDVIEVELSEGCNMATYLAIKDDFNEQWAKEYGYNAEVLVPIQANKLTSIFWVGRSASAEAFGKAWDHWNAALMDDDSVASKLWARFLDCSTNIDRQGYDAY